MTVSSALLLFVCDGNKLLNPTLLDPCIVHWPWLDHLDRVFFLSFFLYALFYYMSFSFSFFQLRYRETEKNIRFQELCDSSQ